MDTERAVSFPEAVLLRPHMYTLAGSYEEVIAFLEGYISGIAKSNPSAPTVVQWGEFRKWLAVQTNSEPDNVFRAFKHTLSLEQDATAEMLKWLQRFEAERPR